VQLRHRQVEEHQDVRFAPQGHSNATGFRPRGFVFEQHLINFKAQPLRRFSDGAADDKAIQSLSDKSLFLAGEKVGT
jgi:hypothetical protein